MVGNDLDLKYEHYFHLVSLVESQTFEHTSIRVSDYDSIVYTREVMCQNLIGVKDNFKQRFLPDVFLAHDGMRQT